MKVTENTKISKIIKENNKAIDAISSINPHFKKLKNPFLRKILASRVSVKDAAKIGGVKVEEILKRLEAIGFKVNYTSTTIKKNKNKTPVISKSIQQSLDVRPIIALGVDPFQTILKITNKLNVGEVLEIINSFEPIPLINILAEKGFKTKTIQKDDLFYTYFEKIEDFKVNDTSNISANLFEETYKKYIGKMKYLDVRFLEMPEPMHQILNTIEVLPNDNCLVVEHKKIPQFLLPELEKRNYEILYNKKSEIHYQLLIFKQRERITNT